MTVPYGYCHCGCGGKTNIETTNNARQGRVKGEPRPWLVGHNDSHGSRTRPLAEYYAVEDHGYDTPCWIWQRAISATGYGSIKRDGRGQAAHRWFYAEVKGPIPDGLHVDHLCRVRPCVNPDHLEAVTPEENTRRALPFREVLTHCHKGHPYDEANTVIASNGHRRCRTCRRAVNLAYWHRTRAKQLEMAA